MTNPTPPPPPGQQAGYPQPPGSPNQPYGAPPPGGYGPPQKKGRSPLLVGLIACGALFVLMIVALTIIAAVAPKDSATSTTVSGAAAPGDEGSDGAPAGPGATKDNPAPIGTTVEVAKDWSFTINAVDLDANAEMLKGNMFNKPQVDGNRFISVNATIRNGSDKPGMALGQLKIGALPPSGVRVDQTYMTAGIKAIDPSAQLQPGAQITGEIIFELDPADIPNTVVLVEPQFTLDVNEDQRFFAIQ